MKIKLLLIIPILVFVLSGCATKEPTISPVIEQTINQTNNGLSLPVENKTETKTTINKNMSQETSTENLVAIYKGAVLKTNLGDIELSFYGDESPNTVNNFLTLAQSGFYNGTKFHRVIKDFMIQGGDPNSKDDDWSNDGMGGPGYKFADEFNQEKLVKGSIAMANSGPDTNGSQFFIVTAEATPWLDGKHTNFGKVIKGLEVVEKIENLEVNQNDHPLQDATVNSIELIKK